jgi:4-hydroxybenzoate polyprenyltransferase
MWKRIRLTLEMIKFEHSVFALPFALTGALLAVRQSGLGARTAWAKVGWIVVAMVAARSAAMAFNRLIDAGIDSRNPRTRTRHLPTGVLSRGFTWGFVAVSAVVFVFAAGALNPLFVHQTLHFVLALGAGFRAGRGAGGGLDRHPRRARSPHPLAHRGGHLLDRRLRRDLRLPGL